MEVSKELYNVIVKEISKLSYHIVKKATLDDAKAMAYIINGLADVLAEKMTISDFHEFISTAKPDVREYYYKLLYLIK